MIWLLLGCPAPADSAEAVGEVEALAAPGPYTVGHHQGEVIYVDAEGGDRTLRTSLWYPSEETSGFAAQYLLSKSAVALEDVVAAEGPFPVVVYSHGHQGFAEASAFLCEHLASHGYIVVAPDHTGNTTFDGSERRTAIYYDRPLDLAAALDAVESGALVPLHTTGEALVLGHSFGGYTAFAAAGVAYDEPALAASCAAASGENVCTDWSDDWAARFTAGAADDRLLGLVAMAPGDAWMFGGNVGAIAVPTLLMTGEFDPERLEDGATYHDALAPLGGHTVNIVGGAHNTFTDVAGAMADGQTLEPAEGWRLVRTYVLAFTETVLGRPHEGVLSGDVEVGSAAEVE